MLGAETRLQVVARGSDATEKMAWRPRMAAVGREVHELAAIRMVEVRGVVVSAEPMCALEDIELQRMASRGMDTEQRARIEVGLSVRRSWGPTTDGETGQKMEAAVRRSVSRRRELA
jgi:hypothetical protein